MYAASSVSASGQAHRSQRSRISKAMVTRAPRDRQSENPMIRRARSSGIGSAPARAPASRRSHTSTPEAASPRPKTAPLGAAANLRTALHAAGRSPRPAAAATDSNDEHGRAASSFPDVPPLQPLEFPWPELPSPGSALEVAPGVFWLRMPLPFALDHINLWQLAGDGDWTQVDSGYGDAATRALWERHF